MKILLINPSVIGRLPIAFPINLAYIAKVLLQNGHKVTVIDMDGDQLTYNQVTERIHTVDFNIVGLTGIVCHYKFLKRITRDLKRDYPNKKIIVGGSVISPIPELFMENTDADIAVVGEGEVTVVELLETLFRKSDLGKVKGIAYKTKKGVVITPPRGHIPNLDEIPFPAWDLFPIENYVKYAVVGYEKRRSLNILTSRGCPYQCVYCYDTFGKKTRMRSPENVIEEMKELKRKYRINCLNFYDETLIVDRDRVIKLCNMMIKEKLNFSWDCNGRVNLVDEELLRVIKKAGCTDIEYGIESGSQEILDRMKKGVTVKQAAKAIRMARKAGLNIITPLMIGMPNETEKTVRQSVEFYKKMKIIANIFYTTPNPGTPLYEEMKRLGKITDEDKYMESLEEGYTDIRLNMTKFSDEKLRFLKESAERKIFINYLIGNWYKIPKIVIERYFALGLRGVLKNMFGYLKDYSFIKSN